MFEQLWQELAQLPEVKAVALGGSRAGGRYDEKSDYDLYLYVTALPAKEKRQRILEKYCRYIELGNTFWETEDDCTLKNGIDIDILYRNLNSFVQGVASVVEECNASTGYTTCMWHNLLTCKVLYDEQGRLAQAKERFAVPYPKQLKLNIIEKNRKLLQGKLPSYDGQLHKALQRRDLVSVNHRSAAFMESYFDIIFALNELTHPGEKREVEYALLHANKLPENFAENIERLFMCLFSDTEEAERLIGQMILALDRVLD